MGNQPRASLPAAAVSASICSTHILLGGVGGVTGLSSAWSVPDQQCPGISEATPAGCIDLAASPSGTSLSFTCCVCPACVPKTTVPLFHCPTVPQQAQREQKCVSFSATQHFIFNYLLQGFGVMDQSWSCRVWGKTSSRVQRDWYSPALLWLNQLKLLHPRAVGRDCRWWRGTIPVTTNKLWSLLSAHVHLTRPLCSLPAVRGKF